LSFEPLQGIVYELCDTISIKVPFQYPVDGALSTGGISEQTYMLFWSLALFRREKTSMLFWPNSHTST
jgi:hypothetical protein